jgi:hypothetical protein
MKNIQERLLARFSEFHKTMSRQLNPLLSENLSFWAVVITITAYGYVL